MALEFDGDDAERVNLANSVDFSPGLGIFTVAGRFRTTHDFSVIRGWMFYDRGLDTDCVVCIAIWDDNKLYGLYRDVNAVVLEVKNLGVVVNDGVVHTIVWVRETQTTARLYLDGASIGTDTDVAMAAVITSDGDIPVIACSNFGAFANFYYGNAFDFRLYKGKAFSAAEAQTYHEAQGIDNIVDGLVARWPMNEAPDGIVAAGANTVIDISGNGNHGTPVNNPTYRGASAKLVRPIVSG